MQTKPNETAIILFAHGSRDPLWHQPIEAVKNQLRHNLPHTPVECAYLEISQPDLPTAAKQLIANNAEPLKAVTIVPLFLGVGKHAREDLPHLVNALRQQYPQIGFTLKSAVGEDPRLIALLAHLAQENTP